MTVICVDDEALILQRTVTMLKKTKKFLLAEPPPFPRLLTLSVLHVRLII